MQRDEGKRSEIAVSDGNKYLSMPDKIATKLPFFATRASKAISIWEDMFSWEDMFF